MTNNAVTIAGSEGINMNTLPLCEQYRPATWRDVSGQDKAVKMLQALMARCWGRCIWLSGKTGTGKTTLARIYAEQGADLLNISEMDGSKLTKSMLEISESEWRMLPMGIKPGRAWIINEAHMLTPGVIGYLLTLIERKPSNVAMIFTTTIEGQDFLFDNRIDSTPLITRCVEIPLAQRGIAQPMAQRVLEIAQTEGLDGGSTIDRVIKLLQQKKNSMRAVLQSIEAGALL